MSRPKWTYPICPCDINDHYPECKYYQPGIVIVSAPRPVKDDAETWRQMIANGLRKGPQSRDRARQFLDGEFVECDSCAAKSGSPDLCNGCLANRHNMGK